MCLCVSVSLCVCVCVSVCVCCNADRFLSGRFRRSVQVGQVGRPLEVTGRTWMRHRRRRRRSRVFFFICFFFCCSFPSVRVRPVAKGHLESAGQGHHFPTAAAAAAAAATKSCERILFYFERNEMKKKAIVDGVQVVDIASVHDGNSVDANGRHVTRNSVPNPPPPKKKEKRRRRNQ